MLKGALGAAIGACVAPAVARAAAAAPTPASTSPHTTAASSPPQARTTGLNDRLALVSGLGGNVLVLRCDDGLLLVDSGGPGFTASLMSQLRGFAGNAPVRTLLNTHWHPDQTGSNEAIGRSGATILAHEKTRLWLATDHYVPEEDRYEKARPRAAWPSRTFYTQAQMTAGTERIDYGYLMEAHTDGDIFVHFRDSNVIAAGGAVSPERDPQLDWFAGGWLGGRIDSLTLLLKRCDAATRVVPGYGPVVGREQLQAELDLMNVIYIRMVDMVRKGYGNQDMLKAGAMQGLKRTFTDPQKFVHDAHKGLWAHHNTLTHDIV